MHVEIWVHGAPARDIRQVVSYLTGDSHDRSKVQIVYVDENGRRSWFDFPLDDETNRPRFLTNPDSRRRAKDMLKRLREDRRNLPHGF